MSNKNKKIFLAVTFPLLVLSAPIATAEELNPNSGGLDESEPVINEEMNNFLSSLVLKNNLLLEETIADKDATPIPPIYLEPFLSFDIELKPFPTQIANLKKSSDKERITLRGSLLIKSKTEEQLRTLIDDCFKEHSDSRLCNFPTEYQINKFSNLNIWTQIWRKDESADTSEKGDYLIDEFYLDQPFNLALNEKKDFVFDWKIPNDIKSGKYYLNFFVNSNNNFDLSGTPLTVFSAGKNYNFEISASEKNARKGKVEIDKNSIRIKDQDYLYRAPANTIDLGAENEFPINFKLVNSSENKENLILTYQLFTWGQTNPQKMFNSKQEKIEIDANSTKDLSFNFKPENDLLASVYNLKIVVEGEGYKSSANVRFVIKDKNGGIFRFLGLVQNKNNSMFSPMFCLRNAAWENLFRGKISLRFYNQKLNEEKKWQSEINLVPETRCYVLKQIETDKDTDFQLEGNVFDENNKQTDQIIFSPLNENISPFQAKFSELTKNYGLEMFEKSKKLYEVMFIVLIILLILILGFFFLSKNRNRG